MSHSEAVVLRSPCPQCGITANRHVFTIISADEHPELIKAIQAGKLHRFECGNCGRVERVDAPVLIYFPGRDRPLLFSPPASAARTVEQKPSPLADRIRLAAEQHLGARPTSEIERLRHRLGPDWRPEWAHSLRIVPRSALRATMAGELVFPDPQDDLAAALGAYLQTVGRAEARSVIEAYSILLNGAVDAWFVEQLNPDATQKTSHDPDGLRMRHSLLRLCRELGVTGAFTHLAQRLLEQTSTPAGTEDGESAIRRIREALSLIRREEAPQVWTLLQVSLGNCLLQRTGGSPQENVEQSIAAYKAALRELGPDNMPELWASATACLANAYVERLTDDRAGNLERAIELYEQALEFRTAERGKAVRAITMNDLAVAYRLRREDIKIKNLDRSVGICEEALSQLSREEAPREWAILQVTLANAMSELAGHQGDNEFATESLDRAIDCYGQALAIHRSLKDSRESAGTLINLANALAERGRRSAALSGDGSADTNAAIADYEEALTLLEPADGPLQCARAMNNLAATLKKRPPRPTEDDLLRAADSYRRGLDALPTDSFLDDRRRMAEDLGDLWSRLRRWSEAVNSYKDALQAADVLFRSAALQSSREFELAAGNGLPARAAYALVQAHRSQPAPECLREAVVLMERGRTRGLREAVARDRADVENVAAHDRDNWTIPSTSHEYRDAVRTLRQLESRERDPYAGSRALRPDREALRQSYREARAKLAQAVSRIQHLPGFERFMKEPEFADIARAILPGAPVAYLMVTAFGGLALVCSRKSDDDVGVEPIWADTLTLDGLELSTAAGWARVMPSARSREGTDSPLELVLARTGERLIGQLAQALRNGGATGVWLVPMGSLAMLPLHACSYEVCGRAVSLLEEFDVAYAPSAFVLTSARDRLAATEYGQPRLVAIADPAPGTNALPFARVEVHDVASLFDRNSAPAVLRDAEATEKAFFDHVPHATYLHLACHGRFDAARPLDSRLELANGHGLTLRRILDQPVFGQVRLVVLSACQTAVAEYRRLPDEVIGLPAGFMQAGTPGVVGTLWSVDDVSTSLLVGRFYELHLHGDGEKREGPMPPSRALCRAQQWLRALSAGEIASRFDALRKLPLSEHRLPYDEVSSVWRRFAMQPPKHRPFDSAYFWAAFTFTGA